MPTPNKDRLIDTGTGNSYFIAILFLVTAIGALFTFHIQPAFDPSTLLVPYWITYVEYTALTVGGFVAGISFIVALYSKVATLYFQLIGLGLQTLATIAIGISVIAFAGIGLSPFILAFVISVAAMHFFRLKFIVRELRNAPLKQKLAIATEEALLPQKEETHGDKVLQTIQYLQSRNDVLALQIANM